jgi:hypothetical protein
MYTYSPSLPKLQESLLLEILGQHNEQIDFEPLFVFDVRG